MPCDIMISNKLCISLAGIFSTANGSDKRSNTRKTGSRRGGSGRGKATQNVQSYEGEEGRREVVDMEMYDVI